MSKCPECGEGILVEKMGSYGRFLSCSNWPDCEYSISLKKRRKCPFNKCDGSGIIPVKGIKGGYNFCECSPVTKAQDPHYTYTRPSDIDFPVSWTFWRGICQQEGWGDPGSNTPEPEPDYSSLEERVNRLEGKKSQVYQNIESQYRMPRPKPQVQKRLKGYNL